MKAILKGVLDKVRFVFLQIILPNTRAIYRSRELKAVQDNTHTINNGDILLFATLRNEGIRIPHFLDYYRNLGVAHFLFVDNNSEDDFRSIVSNEEDVSVWYTEASYKRSKFGMDWLNYLLSKYGVARWCVTVDPDEYLVYPHCEYRNLKSLTEHLENTGKSTLKCVMLDMYGEGEINNARCVTGTNPLDICPYYDAVGYTVNVDKYNNSHWTQGGPRMRVFFRDNPKQAPALNKIPVVKWRRYYSYISSMHYMSPRRLNVVHQDDNETTGCILHFKFMESLVDKAKEEMKRKEHFANSREYESYLAKLETTEGIKLMWEHSDKYQNSKQLIDHGLMFTGDWY